MEGSVPLYVGDDVTDEDAFAALKGKGLGLRVGRPDEPTEADYVLDDVPQVGDFLRWLKEQAVKK
jgi:trehalose-phosphatase